MTMLGPSSDALSLDEVRGAFNDYRRAGYELGITALDVLWCPALLLQGQPEAALEVIEQGLSTAAHNSERIFEAELYRLKARTLLARGAVNANADAQSLLHQALTTARNQHARSLEFRAAKDLAALWMDQDRHAEAIDLLNSVAALFPDGLGTQRLKEKKGAA